MTDIKLYSFNERPFLKSGVSTLWRFNFDGRKNKQIIRSLLFQLLSDYLKKPINKLNIDFAENSPPKINETLNGEKIHTSISYSQKFSIIGLSIGKEIGVDVTPIEYCEECFEVARHYLPPNVMKYMEKLSEKEISEYFTVEWAKMEAKSKVLKVGLSEWDKKREEVFNLKTSVNVFVVDSCAIAIAEKK